MNEGVCSKGKRSIIASEWKNLNFRKVEIVPFGKRTLTINILIHLSRPASSSSKERNMALDPTSPGTHKSTSSHYDQVFNLIKNSTRNREY